MFSHVLYVQSFSQSVQSLSRVWLFATPWTAAHQASLSFTNSWSLLRLVSVESVTPPISSSVIPFSCLQSFPVSGSFPMSQLFASDGHSIGVSASASVLPMNTQNWSPLGWTGWILAVQGTLKSLLQHHSSKASILCCFGTMFQFSSVAQSCLTLCNPMNHSTPGLPSITNSWSLPKLMSIESVMPSSHLILCRPLLLLPPIPPSIRVFSTESTLRMMWPKYWSFSFSIRPSNEHPGLVSFRMNWLDLLAVQGTLKSFLNTTVQKHQFFSAQLSSQSNSHIRTWPLEKPTEKVYKTLLRLASGAASAPFWCLWQKLSVLFSL